MTWRKPKKGSAEPAKEGQVLDFPRKVSAPTPLERGEQKRILVVDDEPHMVRLLRLNLEPEGYQVMEATDGETAYEVAISSKPDIVLLDVAVPRKNGIEVCKAIKNNSDTAHIPVILITARGEGMRKAGLASGADLFMTKPFSPLRLLAEIRRMADKKE